MEKYDELTESVLQCLRDSGYSESSVQEHKYTYASFRKHLLGQRSDFSMASAIEWLEKRRASWQRGTYRRHRAALYRLGEFQRRGGIGRIDICGDNYYAYHDSGDSYTQLQADYKFIAEWIYSEFSKTLAHSVAREQYRGVCKFLLFLESIGCNELRSLSINHIFSFILSLNQKKSKHISGIRKLLSCLFDEKFIPRCYLSITFYECKADVGRFRLPDSDIGNVLHPSKVLESKADEFFSELNNRGYSKASLCRFEKSTNDFFKFLETNQLAYSHEQSDLRINELRRICNDAEIQCLRQFVDYLQTGTGKSVRKYRNKPILLDGLPDWSRQIVLDFLELREREGCAEGTINSCRSASVRFFSFLNGRQIGSPSEITPSIIKEFHNTDAHTTPKGRSTYMGIARKLLRFMEQKKLVQPNLWHALQGSYAPSHGIVSVLTPEMLSAIYAFRNKAAAPFELRDIAIVMIGLRMGLRMSDIVKLKITDFDLSNSKLSFIQAKTRKANTLPVPAEVGNSVYRYVSEGRPQSGHLGDAYIFISHKAPFRPISIGICKKALDRVLAASGINLPSGHGFHITRRTFATQLLTSGNGVDRIVESLGHTGRESVDKYLSHDAGGMRLCPLPFSIGGAVCDLFT